MDIPRRVRNLLIGGAPPRPHVLPAADFTEDDRLHLVPPVHDVLVRQSQREVIAVEQPQIALPVVSKPIRSVVGLFAIDFDDEAISDDMVVAKTVPKRWAPGAALRAPRRRARAA